MVRLEGLGQLKNPMTSSRAEAATWKNKIEVYYAVISPCSYFMSLLFVGWFTKLSVARPFSAEW
jgi:hypothetical protein